MSTTTTNFGWTVPSDTDLVKDGAAAIRTALGGVDTSFVDLKGGTTGQILSKASGTDLDYTWIDQNTGDITGVTAGTGISGGGTSGTVTVTNSMATAIDAKGDLIAGTGSDAFARLAVGTNGYVLTADSAESTGLKWAASSGGGLVKLASGTFSASSNVNPGSYFNSTYKRYKVVMTVTGSSNNADLWLRFRYSSNTTSGTTSYYSTYIGRAYDTSTISGDVNNGSGAAIGRLNAANTDAYNVMEWTFGNIGQGSTQGGGYSGIALSRSGGGVISMAGWCQATQAWDGIEFYPGAGTITGSYTLYGLAD